MFASLISGYDFKLTTILVIDEFGEGCPVAWCLSNREDLPLLRVFFDSIKKAVGNISPEWFMSDMAPQFFDGFCLVFGQMPKQLYCTWHVDKAWKENLRKRIRDFEVEVEVYKQLRTVLEQTDEKMFDHFLEILEDRLANSKITEDFAEYFTMYSRNKERWGYYARAGLGINTNMFCEAFHRVFKYTYLKGKVNKRVDRCLVNLLKFNRDKTFERLRKITKGKRTGKLKQIDDRHDTSTKMALSKITAKDDGCWEVESEDGKRKYLVSRVSEECEEANCQLRCAQCSVCTHQFSCTCIDHMLYSTICKHVHLLSRFMKVNGTTRDGPTDETCFEASSANFTEIEFLHQTVAEKESTDVEKVKQNIQQLLATVEMGIKDATNDDMLALRHLLSGLHAAKNTYEVMKRDANIEKIPVTTNAPSNKCLDTQRRFYQTSKRKKTATVRLAKPTDEEKDAFESLPDEFLQPESTLQKKSRPDKNTKKCYVKIKRGKFTNTITVL